MQTYKCKCGLVTSWSSMGHQPCEGCDECNTTFAQHPDDHKVREPHEWVTEQRVVDGKVVHTRTYCKNCYSSKLPPKGEKK